MRHCLESATAGESFECKVRLGSVSKIDRAYRLIKARAIACEFGPDEPIHLRSLASQLGVSAARVRVALEQLVTEGLVARKPRNGFVAVGIAKASLPVVYRLNRRLLSETLRSHKPGGDLLGAALADVAGIGYELELDCPATGDRIAEITGRLFSCIARLSATRRIVRPVQHINDRLYSVRKREQAHLDDVPAELLNICMVLLADQRTPALRAIADYHDRRLALSPRLLERLSS